MPLPTLLCFAFAAGIATAVAGRLELRSTPRPSWSTRTFGAYLLFALVLLLPVSLYFYAFHGDWFLLYLLPADRIPSAVALLGFGAEALTGALGFTASAQLVRAQRESLAIVFAASMLAIGGGVAAIFGPRLSVVGTYAQYHGGFGLQPLRTSWLMPGMILMVTVLVVGLAAMLARIHWGARRAA